MRLVNIHHDEVKVQYKITASTTFIIRCILRRKNAVVYQGVVWIAFCVREIA